MYSMRAGKDAVMFRIANAAHSYGLTPNMMTAMGLAFGLASGALFAVRFLPAAFALGVLSVFCDVVDGTLARKFHMESKFGLIFDSAADRSSEAAVVLGALAGRIINPFGVIAIAGSMLLLACRAAAYRRGYKTDYVLFGRFERLVFILAGLLVPNVWGSTLCFVTAGILGLVSACQIAINLYRQSKT
ncbi:MAG: CDP-alcohol phosphatidyltransferase family protein [Candidatus Bathyarchaeota archaeon]|nr:CDP-alcohol phosphatidyltransferase family protein [Candidatus Bathyarchaeota archaeon]